METERDRQRERERERERKRRERKRERESEIWERKREKERGRQRERECVGKQCQAVSRGSVAGHLVSPHTARYRARWEGADEQERGREERSTLDSDLSPCCGRGGAMSLCKARRRGRA